MPSSITHAYIAKDITDILSPKIQKKIINYHEEYKTYSQGTDIFYFYKIFNQSKNCLKIREFGSLCHHIKTNELLINIIDIIKKTKDIHQFMFLIGLITHYVTDFTMHPYINYKAHLLSNRNYTEKDAHFFIETYLDNYMINKKENIPYQKFKCFSFCYNTTNSKEVITMLNDVFKKTFNEENMGFYYDISLKDNHNFFKYFRYDKYRFKWYLYNIVNPLAKHVFRDVRYLTYNFPLNKNNEILNLKKESWYNIHDKKLISNKSIPELYEETLVKTKKIIEEVYEYIYENKETDLNLLLENRSYSTGTINK